MKQLTGSTCIVALGALLLCACGAAVAPKELLSARDAYAAAEGSSAKNLAPVQLEEAKQALAEADQAFSEGEDEQRIRDLAYIAGRKAEIAQSRGKRAELDQQREASGVEGSKLQEQVLESKTKALKKTKEELDREQREAAAAKAQLVAVQGRLSAALKSLDELAQVKEEARGVVITLSGSVLFATGKHQLLDIAKDRLNEVAKAIKDQGFKAIVVEGYTDSRGSETANEQLSLKRAEEVRAHLVSQGIPPNKITAVGRGEASPVADNNTAEGRANNRRVELVITPEN
ncbi:MAG TPA: OmpA family protein [Polyangiaceae bacterium]|nr:OmpA family protein [Polyangiaceae bacterium]